MCVCEPVKLVYGEAKKALQDPKKTKVYSIQYHVSSVVVRGKYLTRDALFKEKSEHT